MNIYNFIIMAYTLMIICVLICFIKKIMKFKERELLYGETVYIIKKRKSTIILVFYFILSIILICSFAVQWLRFNNYTFYNNFDKTFCMLNQVLTILGLVSGFVLEYSCNGEEIGENGIIYNNKIFFWEEISEFKWDKYTYTDRNKWVLRIITRNYIFKSQIEWDIKEEEKDKIDKLMQIKILSNR